MIEDADEIAAAKLEELGYRPERAFVKRDPKKRSKDSVKAEVRKDKLGRLGVAKVTIEAKIDPPSHCRSAQWTRWALSERGSLPTCPEFLAVRLFHLQQCPRAGS